MNKESVVRCVEGVGLREGGQRGGAEVEGCWDVRNGSPQGQRGDEMRRRHPFQRLLEIRQASYDPFPTPFWNHHRLRRCRHSTTPTRLSRGPSAASTSDLFGYAPEGSAVFGMTLKEVSD